MGNIKCVDERKRHNKIVTFIVLIVVLFLGAVCNFGLYYNAVKDKYVTYTEESSIDYVVHLDENEFFEDVTLGENNKYIASLIDKISAKFDYKLSLKEKDVKYKYSYKVESIVNVKEKKSTEPLYTKVELLDEVVVNETVNNEVKINYTNDNIDYDKYNNYIKKFIALYDLEDIESTLTINMTISVVGECGEFASTQEDVSVISLVIPLTTKTVGIQITDNLVNTENKIKLCEVDASLYSYLLFIGGGLVLLDIILLIYIINYDKNTTTPIIAYKKNVKRILSNYDSCIQRVEEEVSLQGLKVIKVSRFIDLLDIKDTIRKPILFNETLSNNSSTFVILSDENRAYKYILKCEELAEVKEVEEVVEEEVQEENIKRIIIKLHKETGDLTME